MADPKITQKAADNIRVLSAAMVEKANSGHPGGAMGGADFMHILFTEYMNYDPKDTAWPFRDRFFLDPGHMSAMLYSQLHLLGLYSTEDLQNFRQWGSPTPGHPELDVARGVENTSGPLGQGHTFGIGAAIAERFLVDRFGEWMAHKTFIYISDGGIQEEVSQGAGRTAGYLGLGNVVMFYDANDIQLSSEVSEVMDEDTGKKYEAWGWHVQTIEGNDQDAIRKALDAAVAETERPSLIIGKTIMGKGAVTEDGSSFERQVSTHGKPLSGAGASFNKTVEALGGNPENPFAVFPEVAEFYEEVKTEKHAYAEQKRTEHEAWAAAHPEKAGQLEEFLSGELPELDWAGIKQKPGQATRNASGAVLSYLADHLDNMIVASADLSNSDKTDAFLKKTSSFTKGDFSGAFLQAGVSELTMAALCTGMALHGGVVPVCATFFVFSDFMKPTIRLAALMEQPVIFIWTHDAFRVGEDGPTHQPVEQEAQIRLLEQLQNHSGRNGFLALRPADVDETTVAWKLALENTHGPSGLILSRQDIASLPANGSRYEAALEAAKGAYIVQKEKGGNPDLILVGNGSEVATLIEGAKLLQEKKKLKVRVVSAPSEGLFRNQPIDYQLDVLPYDVPTYGLTAGLPVTLRGLVGPLGEVAGLDHFGASAPYDVLDEKFGFTAERVYEGAVSYLEDFE
ncbi:MAG: transketolase [Phaeodactylibacter sp.]|uniref:transketolase family protein n=1 Tax=Phaeodactylibacter sp. TaxID=1940289 RepID=UPI0032EC18AD